MEESKLTTSEFNHYEWLRSKLQTMDKKDREQLRDRLTDNVII